MPHPPGTHLNRGRSPDDPIADAIQDLFGEMLEMTDEEIEATSTAILGTFQSTMGDSVPEIATAQPAFRRLSRLVRQRATGRGPSRRSTTRVGTRSRARRATCGRTRGSRRASTASSSSGDDGPSSSDGGDPPSACVSRTLTHATAGGAQ